MAGEYRVTKAVTHNGHYYQVGDVVTNEGGLAGLFGWELIPKAASAPRKKGARKPAVKK